jgi:hypothetical protein
VADPAKPLSAVEKKRLLRAPRSPEAIEAGHDYFIDDAQARVKQIATQIRGMIKSWPEKVESTVEGRQVYGDAFLEQFPQN